jgi:putative FmdB family regulatory protein
MPTYDYQCDRCGHRFERFQSMSDAPVRTCPECGGEVRRLIGAGAAVISRSGGSQAAGFGPDCGRDAPCCGRDSPCETRPCEE